MHLIVCELDAHGGNVEVHAMLALPVYDSIDHLVGMKRLTPFRVLSLCSCQIE